MTLDISDNFNDRQGRWAVDGVQMWDTTAQYYTDAAWMSNPEQKHVNLRSFIQDTIKAPRTQSMLDDLFQSELEDDFGSYNTQENIDFGTLSAGEYWIHVGAGFTDPTTGTLSGHRNLKGLVSAATGNPVDDYFESHTVSASVPIDQSFLDISTMTYLSIVMPDLGPADFDQDLSHVILSSDPNGAFDYTNNPEFISSEVPFSSNINLSGAELRLPLSAFTTGSGASFDLSLVSGIRIYLSDGSPTVATHLTLMSIRAVGSDWIWRPEDFDTILGGMKSSATLDGRPSSIPTIPILRGNGGSEDPSPTDASLMAYFSVGNIGYDKDTFEDPNELLEYTSRDMPDNDLSELAADGSLHMSELHSNPTRLYHLYEPNTEIIDAVNVTVGFIATHGIANPLGDLVFLAQAEGKYVDMDNHVSAYVTDDGSQSKLGLLIRCNGIDTIESMNIDRLIQGNEYWVRCAVSDGDEAAAEMFDTPPLSVGAVPIATSKTIALDDTPNFSRLIDHVKGYAGLVVRFIDEVSAITSLIIDPLPILNIPAVTAGFSNDTFSSEVLGDSYEDIDIPSSPYSELLTDGRLSTTNTAPNTQYALINRNKNIYDISQITVGFIAEHGGVGDNPFVVQAVGKYIDENNYLIAKAIDVSGVSKIALAGRANGSAEVYHEVILPDRFLVGDEYWIRCRIPADDSDLAIGEFFKNKPDEIGSVPDSATPVIDVDDDDFGTYVDHAIGQAGVIAQLVSTNAAITSLTINPLPTTSQFDILELYFREQHDQAAHTGDWVVARLKWNTEETVIESAYQKWDGTVLSEEGLQSKVLKVKNSSDNLILQTSSFGNSDEGRYVFKAALKGSTVSFSILKTNSDQHIEEQVSSGEAFSSPYYKSGQSGRVGFRIDFWHLDAYLDELSATTSGYGALTSKIFTQRTPVDGVQLSAAFSEDEDLLRSISWIDHSETDTGIDTTKTLSGLGSYKTARGIFTNDFVINDWINTYLEFDIWVPSTVTINNQPRAFFRSHQVPDIDFPIPELQGNRWNHVSVDFSTQSDTTIGYLYHLVIEPQAADIRLGSFWIDNLKIGHKTIDWQIKVRSGDSYPWRSLHDVVNNGQAALHFPRKEIGRELQIRAVALAQDAWVSSFTLVPRHAQLGLPIYDQGYETRP